MYLLYRGSVSVLASPKKTEMLVPFGEPVAFPRMAGTSRRGQQLAAPQSGFLCVQKHHYSTQGDASPATRAARRGGSFRVHPPVRALSNRSTLGTDEGRPTARLQMVHPGPKEGRKHRAGWCASVVQETLDMSNFLAAD